MIGRKCRGDFPRIYADFYRGKQVKVIVGFGSGGVKAANYMYNAGPKDGSVLGMVSANPVLMAWHIAPIGAVKPWFRPPPSGGGLFFFHGFAVSRMVLSD